MSSDVNACGLCNDGLSDVLIIFKALNNVLIKVSIENEVPRCNSRLGFDHKTNDAITHKI